MNVGDEPSSSSGYLPPRQIQNLNNFELRPEEIKEYKSCTRDLFLKGGVPLAAVCQYIINFRKKGTLEFTPQTILKNGVIFLGNAVLLTLFLTPICVQKMAVLRDEFERREKLLEDQKKLINPRTQSLTQAEEFSYPADLMSNFNEPEISYSQDFSPSKILSDEAENLNPPSTTYEKLRTQHRTNAAKKQIILIKSELDQLGANLEKPVTREPQRTAKKNIYGDEI